MNLQSPLFDAVRIPGRASLSRIIERVCHERGVPLSSMRSNRNRYPSDEMLETRRELLISARAAKFPYSQIGDWFGHRDSSTVQQWCEDLGGK